MLAFCAVLFGIFMFMFAIKCPFVRNNSESISEGIREGIDKSPSSSGFSELVTELVRKSE
jgi:hypothetical protein